MNKETRQKLEVIMQFEPTPDFEQEWLEFIEEVLNWPTAEEQLKAKSNEEIKTT